MAFTYDYYVNGEKRPPTEEERETLMERMMRCFGYERKDKKEDKKASA